MPIWARAILLGIGALMIVSSIWIYIAASQRAAAAEEWPGTRGRVVAARTEFRTSTDSDGDRSDSYTPIVTFEYAVNGRTYRSTQLYLNESPVFSDEGDARAFLHEYRPGTPLQIWYDPANPQEAAVIIEGPSWAVGILTVMGLIFAAVGWFFPKNKPMRPLPKMRFNRTRP
jgi:hypothetical protein